VGVSLEEEVYAQGPPIFYMGTRAAPVLIKLSLIVLISYAGVKIGNGDGQNAWYGWPSLFVLLTQVQEFLALGIQAPIMAFRAGK